MNTTQDPKLVKQYTKYFLNNKDLYHQTPHKKVDNNAPVSQILWQPFLSRKISTMKNENPVIAWSP